jgi:sugar lactone lactonase YvrE
VVREVLANGSIKTVAGNGNCTQNVTGDGGPATSAAVCQPTGVVVDNAGNLYIAQTGNNAVRKVTPSGTISTFAGTGGRGSTGDLGPATSAKLSFPTGLAIDAVNDVFIADTGNSKVRVVNAAGIITTFAGTGSYGYGGDNGPAISAMLAAPTGLGIDGGGNVYISDTNNNRLRKVTTASVISTYAGTGAQGNTGDGGPALSATLNHPAGAVAIDGVHVYFADTGNNRGRVSTDGPPPVIAEIGYILLLPLSALLIGGAIYLVVQRRRTAATPVPAI